MRGTRRGETEVQQDRSRGEGDYQARHQEKQRAGKRGLVLASIMSAAAGRGGRDRADPGSARGRHEGARVRRPGFRRRGSHGVAV
jgi:hypothetical protein